MFATLCFSAAVTSAEGKRQGDCGGHGEGSDDSEGVLRGLLLPSQHAVCAEPRRGVRRRSARTIPRACDPRSRCGSSSARSGGCARRGRSPRPRNRPRCTQPEPTDRARRGRARIESSPVQREEWASVRITVLGKSPSWQDAGGACSGYLVQHEGTRCCWTAATACSQAARRVIDYVDLDAVVISHMHADHCLDLVPYAYALTYAPRQQPVPVAGYPGHNPARPVLHIPPGATRDPAHPR